MSIYNSLNFQVKKIKPIFLYTYTSFGSKMNSDIQQEKLKATFPYYYTIKSNSDPDEPEVTCWLIQKGKKFEKGSPFGYYSPHRHYKGDFYNSESK